MEDGENRENHSWDTVQPREIIPGFASFASEELIRTWGLVLASQSTPYRIEHDADGWQLLVPLELIPEVVAELQRFEGDNRNWPPVAPPFRPMRENSLATISILFLIATFHNITRLNIPLFGYPPPDWLYIGSAKVHLINYGEWWRLVTALTLHGDWLHLFSNMTIGGFFVLLLCRELGSGLAWSLLLAAGTLGNLANAHFQLPTHSSVGSSTAIFGAVGMLAVINLMRYRLNSRGRWKVIVAAALALLTLLGTEGKNTDLGAHLFGFIFGTGLGFVSEFVIARKGRPGEFVNGLLAVASGVVVIGAWWAAVRFGG